MIRKAKQWIAWLFRHPVVRYDFLQPLWRIWGPDYDETIFQNAFGFAAHNNPDGDYLEFGVWKGRSFAKAYNIWKYSYARKGKLTGMQFFAFDSFQGLPEISSAEDRSTGEFKRGDYAMSEDAFRRALISRRVDMSRVHIVPGWYDAVLNDETKKNIPIKRAAVIFIDCDLYESTVPVLEFISDYVVDGTVIIFDDWFCFKGRPDKGEQKAFGEWLEHHAEIRAIPWHAVNWKTQSFILYRV